MEKNKEKEVAHSSTEEIEEVKEVEENNTEEKTEETDEAAEITGEQDEVDETTEEKENELEKKYEKEIEELNNRLLRQQADYENLRRRMRLDQEAAAKYRSQNLIESLLPVIDNFERGLQVEPNSDEEKSLLQGMEMVYKQLQEALEREGVQVIDTVGHPFDPNFHEAVMQVEEEGVDSNEIIEELQKGYMLKDRVIRPAMVKVGI